MLVLDLDETLIFATEQPLIRPCDFQAGPYAVYRRPFVREFLEECLTNFEVGIWTSSTRSFADAIVTDLFSGIQSPSFVWSRERCTRRLNEHSLEYDWLKDLAKLKRQGYRLESVIMVDDTPAKLSRNYGNLICAKSWEGDLADKELPKLLIYLKTLLSVPNVRKVDKRDWRHRHLS